MNCREYRRIDKCKSDWNAMYLDKLSIYTPFQSYYSNLVYDRLFKFDYVRFFCKKRFFVVEEDDKKVIIPLIINPLKKNVREFASFSPIDYYDIISNTLDIVFLRKALAYILEQYNDYHICLARFSDSSIIKSVIPEEICGSKELCAEILLTSSYEEYFSSLSKHQRQNIRTAYNRIGKNDISYCIREFSGEEIPNAIWRDCRKMYEDRCNVKDGIAFKKVYNVYKRFSNPVNRMLREIENNATYVLFFGDTPVAFMSGFYSHDFTKFYVPRLSCSNKYYKYDTGIVLLNEVIKRFFDKGVKCIDLTRGGEPYKFAMGGVPHYNYSIHERGYSLVQALKSL